MFNPTKCIGCGDCVSACPQGNHRLSDGVHIYDKVNCPDCGQCVSACCSGALSLCGQQLSAREVMDVVLKDQGVYAETGGGLTVSGGEPLAQAAFTLELLQLAKIAGITTCLETCGHADPETLTQAARYTDLFLYDYKLTDPQLHKQYCGVTNEKILAGLDLLDRLGAAVILRCPIIPNINDTPEHLQGIGHVAAAHSCIRSIQLEPYHRLGIDKSAQLGRQSAYDSPAPARETMEQYCATVFSLCGKSTTIS
jgi:pyruvate formate lyase activating enzyme